MLIHQSLAGCVIGKGGAKIKEIRDVSTPVVIFLQSVCFIRSSIEKINLPCT